MNVNVKLATPLQQDTFDLNKMRCELITIFIYISSSAHMPNSSSYQSDTISANTEQNGISFHFCN